MRIVIVTPLYPPDTAPAAKYVKDLASRLTERHAVTVLAYGHIPEKIPGVRIQTIGKKIPLILRVLLFTYKLLLTSWRADRLLVVNGASTELPTMLVSLMSRRPYIACIADPIAATKAMQKHIFKTIHESYLGRSCRVIRSIPPVRPEVIAFAPYPEKESLAYETSWKQHLVEIES